MLYYWFWLIVLLGWLFIYVVLCVFLGCCLIDRYCCVGVLVVVVFLYFACLCFSLC